MANLGKTVEKTDTEFYWKYLKHSNRAKDMLMYS